jgi:phosphoglycolate phosphatase-like HAD superfamily hydrolase
MIKRIHIFDMDGTLVDSSHRYRTMPCGTRIDLQHWRDNEHRAADDTLLPIVAKYRALLDSPCDYVVIATARIGDTHTREFLKRHGIEPQAFIARRDDTDNRGGAELKIAAIRRLLNLRQFQGVEEFHIYEDNRTYLNKMWAAFRGYGRAVCHFFPSNQGH